MAENTNIEWADHTFNPWEGCTKVGPGCDHCYAEARNLRFVGGENWGAGSPRRRTSPANWKKPLRWNEEQFCECRACHWRGSIPWGSCLASDCPSCRARELVPARARVFCASLADVFDNEVDPQWRKDLFGLISATPNLDWLLLTKRIGNVGPMLFGMERVFPANVWLGATIVNPEEAERDIPKLLRVPAAVHFLSMEPLLAAVDIAFFLEPDYTGDLLNGPCEEHRAIDWVIVGGESGPSARPMNADWVRTIRDQCVEFATPFLFKQWGEYAPNWFNDEGGNMIEGSEWMDKIGKKKAGRTLDGKTHTDFPVVQGC